MFGFQSSNRSKGSERDTTNDDVAKLFFDTFSKRVVSVEGELTGLSSELEKLKISMDRVQISDLVLLERIQRVEVLVKESVSSIRESVEKAYAGTESSVPRTPGSDEVRSAEDGVERVVLNRRLIASHVSSPIGQLGPLPSITTPTELQVLTLLAEEGARSAPEMGRAIGRSREHTARLMRKLYQEGYIRRDNGRIPFKYSLVEKVKQSFKKTEVRDGAEEQISVPQT